MLQGQHPGGERGVAGGATHWEVMGREGSVALATPGLFHLFVWTKISISLGRKSRLAGITRVAEIPRNSYSIAMRFFDAHTHIHFAAFAEDSAEVIQRALDAGVWMLTVGTQRDTSKSAVEIANQYTEGVYAAIGLHPVHTTESYHDEKELGGGEAAKAFVSRGEEFDFEYYLELARDPKVVAIGECGLDYYRPANYEFDTKVRIRQIEVFKKHIQIAQEAGKALMVHCRPTKGTENAYEDLHELLEEMKPTVPIVIHFYVGGPVLTKKFVDAGYHFTLGGVITFARDYDESIALIPLDRILSETDAPYVAPEPYRGKRNEPLYIPAIVRKLAELKGVSYDEMAQITFENATRIFKMN